MAENWYPNATRFEIKPGSNDPTIKVRGAILHVTAGTGGGEAIGRYFRDASGGIESHFMIDNQGKIWQYRSLGYEADANHKANSFTINGTRWGYVSIETQGLEGGTWNDKQLASIKELLSWLSDEFDFPLEVCESPTDKGVGYHVMWGAPGPWTPVAKSCPGPKRVKQFEDIIVPWMKQGDAPKPAPKPAAGTYVVKSGDTLGRIAAEHKTTVAELVKLNDLIDPNLIYAGQELKLPQAQTPSKPKPAPFKPEKLAAGVKPYSRHKQVRVLQQALLDVGLSVPGAVTDFYGNSTRAAVAKWHDKNPKFKSEGVKSDPVIGPKGFQELQIQAHNRKKK